MKRFSSITTTQLARICGVSQGTVDRAIHNRPGIKEETRERILAIAKEYSYLPNAGSQSVPGRSMLIGVVLYDLYNPFFSKLAMSLVESAKVSGYSVIFRFSEKVPEAEKAAMEYFDYIGVDGIILFSVGSDDETYANYLHSLKRPVVAMGNRLFDLTYVGVDDSCAMYDLTKCFLENIETGEIIYFSPSLKRELHSKNSQRLRLEGFKRAMEEKNCSWRIALSEEELSGDAAGIVCSTDHYALRALRKLSNNYLGRIAGFDHVSNLEMAGHPIYTVEYSTDRIAQESMNYFWRRKYTTDIQHKVLLISPDESRK